MRSLFTSKVHAEKASCVWHTKLERVEIRIHLPAGLEILRGQAVP